MRSSKSRSRNKNRNRPSGGNIINRVFDSSGPEGKVRGTPQQVIEKYNQLARDAQLSGDRVAVENFQQHAEHYTRMLAQAQKEMDAKRDQHQGNQNGGGNQNHQGNQNNQNHQNGGGNQQNNQNSQQPNAGGQSGDGDRGDAGQGGNQNGNQGGGNRRNRNRGGDQRGGNTPAGGAEVIDSDGDTGLVETPEARADSQPEAQSEPQAGDEAAKPKRRTRRKAPKPDEGAAPAETPAEDA